MGDNSSYGFNMERLLEFGMSAAVASQVMQGMNKTMSETMQQWSAAMKAPMNTSQLYYVALNGKQAGPFSETEVVRLINDKKVTKETLIWHQGMNVWKKAEDVPAILRIIALSPPPLEGV